MGAGSLTRAGRPFFVAKSGTELSFRLIRTAVMGRAEGAVIGSTVEPPPRAAPRQPGPMSRQTYIQRTTHDNGTGQVTPTP